MLKSMGAALGAFIFAGTVQAADRCQVGKILEIPIVMKGESPTLHVGLNGHDVQMTLDSGAFYSTLTASTADDLHLKRDPASSGFAIGGVGGEQAAWTTTVGTMTINGYPITSVAFIVGGSEVGTSGLFGDNLLNLADTEYDLAGGYVRLMRPQNCGNMAFAYWTEPGQAYSVIDIQRLDPRSPHTVGDVMINGVRLRAIFDTGAFSTVLKTSAAEKLGVWPTSPGVVPGGITGGIGRHLEESWIGSFASFKIGDEEIKNVHLRFGDVGIEDADMLIGADFFLSHHIYVAHSQRKLYFTYNGGPVFDLSVNPAKTADKDNAKHPAPATGPLPAGEVLKTAAEYYRRGQARIARGDLTGALADLDRAVAMTPDSPDYLYSRAALRRDAGQSKEALDDLDKAVKARPDDPHILMARAELRKDLDDKTGARADLGAADKVASKLSDQRLDLAGLHGELEETPQAIADYDLWLAAHPDDNRRSEAYNGRCWTRAVANRELPLALQDCNKALGMLPKAAAFLDSRALVRFRMGDYADAIVDYDAAIASDPKSALSRYGRGVAELKLGQKDKGEADLKAASALDAGVVDHAKKYGLAS